MLYICFCDNSREHFIFISIESPNSGKSQFQPAWILAKEQHDGIGSKIAEATPQKERCILMNSEEPY